MVIEPFLISKRRTQSSTHCSGYGKSRLKSFMQNRGIALVLVFIPPADDVLLPDFVLLCQALEGRSVTLEWNILSMRTSKMARTGLKRMHASPVRNVYVRRGNLVQPDTANLRFQGASVLLVL